MNETYRIDSELETMEYSLLTVVGPRKRIFFFQNDRMNGFEKDVAPLLDSTPPIDAKEKYFRDNRAATNTNQGRQSAGHKKVKELASPIMIGPTPNLVLLHLRNHNTAARTLPILQYSKAFHHFSLVLLFELLHRAI